MHNLVNAVNEGLVSLRTLWSQQPAHTHVVRALSLDCQKQNKISRMYEHRLIV